MYWLVKEYILLFMKMFINDVMMYFLFVWFYYWYCDLDGCYDNVNEYNRMVLMIVKWCDMEFSD